MKSKIRLIGIVAVMTLLMVTAASVFADSGPSFGPSGQGSGASASVVGGCDQPTSDGRCITHSNDTATITQFQSVSCNAGGLHTDNSYMRRFTLADFGIADDFDVANVEIGIETAAGAGGTQPVDVNLYTIGTGTPLSFGALTPIGSTSLAVADQALTVLTVPVTGTAPGGADLVVELFTPEGQTDGNSFFVGSNGLGQTGPTYIAAADCGISEPTDTGGIGFPDMHWVLLVNGKVAGGHTPEGKTYEVTVIGAPPPTAPAGPPVCLTFGAPDTIGGLQMTQYGQGFWTEFTSTPTRALSQGKIKDGLGYFAQMRVVTTPDGSLRGRMKDNGGGFFRLVGFENPTCGAP